MQTSAKNNNNLTERVNKYQISFCVRAIEEKYSLGIWWEITTLAGSIISVIAKEGL